MPGMYSLARFGACRRACFVVQCIVVEPVHLARATRHQGAGDSYGGTLMAGFCRTRFDCANGRVSVFLAVDLIPA